MLYDLARPFAEQFALFNLFRYLTFRSGGACLTARVAALWLGPRCCASRSATARSASRTTT
jgi:phospho-N-acetylmuramoyl-pentapeptide-transferase